MNPMILGSLISAGASLLGGNIQRNTERFVSSGDNARSHVDGIMDASAKHQINPLTLLGSVGAVGGQALGGSPMGAAIANAGLSIADGMAKKVDFDLQAEQLRMQRDSLQKKLDAATLRPKVDGVYGNATKSVYDSDPDYRASFDYSGIDQRFSGVDPVEAFVPFRMPDGSVVLGPNPAGIQDLEQFSGTGLLTATAEVKGRDNYKKPPSNAKPFVYKGPRGGSVDPRPFPSFKQSRGAALRDPTIPNHLVGR